MLSYYFEANCDHSKVFNVLQEKNINGFYSKHKLTKKYSDYAIKNFGFPNDYAADAFDSDNTNEDEKITKMILHKNEYYIIFKLQ